MAAQYPPPCFATPQPPSIEMEKGCRERVAQNIAKVNKYEFFNKCCDKLKRGSDAEMEHKFQGSHPFEINLLIKEKANISLQWETVYFM